MTTWVEICAVNDIHPNTGVCALLDEQQIAVFRSSGSDEIYAIANYDPIGKANVLSRGLMAQLGDELTVASPLYKQHFNLVTGACLEESDVSVAVFPTKTENGNVFVSHN